MDTVISSKGQIVIPVGIRKELGLTPGTRLDIHCEGNQLVMTAKSGSFEAWANDRKKRAAIKHPLKLDREQTMPPALNLDA